ncbi:cysteine hydrolase family protein [Butyrivibrio sp.]|uniref:cysteine hydrolase family protein n=1 Tax=Butyrivibrio sp. TaxID=28121 RepID=UPI0025BDBD3D|nr:isochorismatase family cysteine hydrolase [Butyrivibrio sp.]MBQ9302464.1 cysteine hydrolase [Butyrivibrio sp.]
MKILLVIDIQEKYLNYYDADLLLRINARITAAKSTGTQVFYVRNIGIHGDDDSYALAKNLLIVSDHIYEKKFPSAFTNDSFAKELKIQNVTEFEIIGVDGNSCVKKTCLDAANAGYKVTLNLQCTAARNEKIFENTLNELRNAGVIITV